MQIKLTSIFDSEENVFLNISNHPFIIQKASYTNVNGFFNNIPYKQSYWVKESPEEIQNLIDNKIFNEEFEDKLK